MPKIKAVAYARFSTDMQREESIDAQVRAIKYYASKYNYEIVAVYADRAKSGRSSERPQFLQMITDSAKGLFEAVIVHNTDIFNLNKKINNLYKAIESGLNAEETTKRINTLVAEKDALEVKLMELNCIPEAEKKSVDELVSTFQQMADIKKLSPKRQKAALNRILKKIIVTETETGYDIQLLINPDTLKNISGFFGFDGGEGGICEYTRFETIKYIIDIGDLSCFSVSIT